MRIALLAPLVAPIAPPYLGGAQALLRDLAAGLAARGHTVTLYAAPGSAVPGVVVRAVPVDPTALRPARFDDADQMVDPERDPTLRAANTAFTHAYEQIRAHAGEHDLVHAHAYDWAAYAYGDRQPLPLVHTLHLPPLDPTIRAALASIAPPGTTAAEGAATLVTVSRACARAYAPYCHVADVIYNGIEVARIPFGARPATPPYLLFAGRVSPEKGVTDALEIATRAGRRLLLAGGIYDEEYYRERVRPHLARAEAEYLGAVARERLWTLMAGTEAVLCPIAWDEPFGLVACEAQAAGAPVIGYARGALPEVVADGATGWLVPPGELAAAADAVTRLGTLDRRACRARAERRFSLGAMLDAYEALYANVLAGRALAGEEDTRL